MFRLGGAGVANDKHTQILCYVTNYCCRSCSYLGPVGRGADLQLVGQLFRHILLQVPPLDLQRHGRCADGLEGARHLYILSLSHAHIFRDLSKCGFGYVKEEEGDSRGTE